MPPFIWDEAKRLENQRKHKFDFVDAFAAFNDPQSYEYRSDRGDEQRCVLIGKSGEAILAVIFTIRRETLRLISVRRARKEEIEKWNANTS